MNILLSGNAVAIHFLALMFLCASRHLHYANTIPAEAIILISQISTLLSKLFKSYSLFTGKYSAPPKKKTHFISHLEFLKLILTQPSVVFSELQCLLNCA